MTDDLYPFFNTNTISSRPTINFCRWSARSSCWLWPFYAVRLFLFRHTVQNVY